MVRCALAAVLAVAALSKAVRLEESAASLEAFGIGGRRTRRGAVLLTIAVELALAAGVAAGSGAAAYAAAALMAGFAAAVAWATATGRRGLPCPCFGARSKIGFRAVGRNLALAAGFAATPALADVSPTRDTWLIAGLGIALTGVVVLGVAVLALAREVAALRLRLPPESALEILSEGPEIGERTALRDRFPPDGQAQFALAVFTSESCHLCRSLEPAVDALARDPLVAVAVFDEFRDVDVWRTLAVPGSPYAVAIDRDGTVRAKGTFNSAAQLESILAAAERRARAAAVV